jgi:hypothetical protein
MMHRAEVAAGEFTTMPATDPSQRGSGGSEERGQTDSFSLFSDPADTLRIAICRMPHGSGCQMETTAVGFHGRLRGAGLEECADRVQFAYEYGKSHRSHGAAALDGAAFVGYRC